MNVRKNVSNLIYKIDGVGVNLEKFYPVRTEEEKNVLRQSYNFSSDDFIVLYTAEFIPRKNHKLIFDILKALKLEIPSLKMVFCGSGKLLEEYNFFATTNEMNDYVLFTGYTNNVDDYCRLADVLVMPSLQEGLPLALIEAMATGLPLVASDIRGHRDVILNYENGILCDLNNPKSFLGAIMLLYKNKSLRNERKLRNIERAKFFSVDNAVVNMEKIYLQVIPPPLYYKLSLEIDYNGKIRLIHLFSTQSLTLIREVA